MDSVSMAIQDESGSIDSVPMDVDVSSLKSIHLKEQCHSGDDLALKVRKPYTITKQRERWTEEEHKKFLEALKLYGRAWRRIEEHVGTKTAVQIRSHAQKFFTKVVRESGNGDTATEKPIEIPPPRPKRKPLHPYPRKVSASSKATALVIEKPACSVAPGAGLLTEDNRSPTSVLSAYCSDAPGATDTHTPEGSLSPVSSAVCGSAGLVLSETPNLSSAKGNVSQSSSQVNNSSNQDEKSPMKLELFPEENSFVKEGSVEVSSTQCLKLFGKTVMVTDSCRPSSPISGTCKVQPSNEIGGKLPQSLPGNLIPNDYSQGSLECSWGALTYVAQAALYCLPVQSEMSKVSGQRAPHSLPWCSYRKVESVPVIQVHSPIPIKAAVLGDCKEVQASEIRKDGSSSNLSSESQSLDDSNSNGNLEAQSCRLMLGKDERAFPSTKPCHETSVLEQRASSCKRTKGFLPYKKRCLVEERGTRSLVIREEREEEQRIRLCL